ncbi:MAG TPA: lamin tail domain-containing protein [Balneolaceae bacterium]
MVPKLQSCLSTYLFFLFAFFSGIIAQDSYAQTTLSPGDLVVVTVNSGGTDNFDFIPLTDLEAGTIIHFTDDAWVSDSAAFRGGEGVITFTAADSVSAGTIISFDASFENGFTETDGDYNASGSGNNLLVYQGDKTDPSFIYGVGWAQSDSWEYIEGITSKSDIPPGLSKESHTILSLGTSNNLQYDALNGTKGTEKLLLSLVGDESNWIENDSQPFSAFSASFELVDPPTVAFTTNFIIVNESDGSISINIKLVESSNTDVSVDVVFAASSSSASSADIGNFSTQTVSFSSEDNSDAVKTIPIRLNDDNLYTGKKTAVFELQNSSVGTILSPDVLTIEIEDNDAPEIVINEILVNPGTNDANKDRKADDGDEFVEIVNKQSAAVDISGWTFADGDPGAPNVQYTFPQGTVVPANGALVLSEGQPDGYFGGAVVQTIDGGLSLNNSDETLFIQNENGSIIDRISYGESTEGESLVRKTDSTLVNHSAIPGANGFLISPGTKANGSGFGGGYSVGIRGGEGWRMISSPTQNTTFADLFGPYRVQGITGSDAPADTISSIYLWNEALGGFRDAPASMSDEMKAGKGYIVYFFADDKPSVSGIQGGFPKILTSDYKENSSTVSVNISVTDRNNNETIDSNEGWNLLGNPFATDISVEAVKNTLSTLGDSLNANIYIWNQTLGGGNGGYEILDNDDTIAPYQAFFVKYMGSSEVNKATINFNRNELRANKETHFYKEISNSTFKFSLELHDDQYLDSYYLEFGEQGNVELDRFDAFKQFSLSPNSISLYSRAGDYRLQKNELPVDLQTTLEIPLLFKARGRNSLTFRWNNIEKIPADWQILLIDKEINREIDLRIAESYQFDLFQATSKISNHSKEKSLLNKQQFKEESTRFVLSITPPKKLAFNEKNLPESIKLNPNYPNPFTSSTTVPFELAEDANVTLTIWNMIGQKVATLVDGVQEAGFHDDVRWNASSMPSGIYIARLEVAGQVFIRKMTLIK